VSKEYIGHGGQISGTTKLVGLLGWPVEHSLSPLIHNAAFRAAGLDYSYVPLAVHPEKLAAAVSGLKAMGFVGVNVTVPHKVKIIEFLDVVDKSAKLVGAVNTIVFEDGLATGYNTDMNGFVHSLQSENIGVRDKQVVLMGAGGASRALVCGFIEHGAASIMVGARSSVKTEEFSASFEDKRVIGCGWDSGDFAEAIKTCDILVNCTPVGMYPNIGQEPPVDWALVPRQAIVGDIIYNPPLTKFLKTAHAAGHRVIDGAGMLVEQGALAFSLWTKQVPPRTIMHQALAAVIK